MTAEDLYPVNMKKKNTHTHTLITQGLFPTDFELLVERIGMFDKILRTSRERKKAQTRQHTQQIRQHIECFDTLSYCYKWNEFAPSQVLNRTMIVLSVVWLAVHIVNAADSLGSFA